MARKHWVIHVADMELFDTEVEHFLEQIEKCDITKVYSTYSEGKYYFFCLYDE